jgi:3',5'-cyclic AMP phosphodiesterase CpdA
MIQLGQYAPPTHTVVHLSDTHYLGGGRALYGAVDTDRTVTRALEQLQRSGITPAAVVITGDLTDLGEADAYQRLRDELEPVARAMGSQLIWVMGNHDERGPFSSVLFDGALDGPAAGAPQDRIYDVDGLRIIALDTSVPSYHHGELTDAQLSWLEEVLAIPAAHGTLLAMHHPPLPSPVEIMAILELQEQQKLADVIRGTDVRSILAGHLHYSTHGTFAGIPVSVASATCYTIDTSAAADTLLGVDGGQSLNLVNLYSDDLRPGNVVHSIVPIGDFTQVAGFSGVVLDKLASMTPEERREAFSSKTSTFGVAEVERSN